ncbi:MAG: YcxB family protein [Chitinophagales bacterium]|nr:YcxB family protein [Chitinophagales bacterium]MDW8394231.1 YcxB family protein [Chitinophagales bacterium]
MNSSETSQAVPIVIRFQYTPHVLQAAHQLHYRTFFPLKGRVLLLVGAVVVVCGMVLTVLPGVQAWLGPALLAYGLLLILFHYYYFSTIGRRVYKRLQEYRQPMEFRITPQRITLLAQNHSVDIPWHHFRKAASNAEFTLLYPNDKTFFIFPRSSFPPGDYERFQSWVQQNLAARQN